MMLGKDVLKAGVLLFARVVKGRELIFHDVGAVSHLCPLWIFSSVRLINDFCCF
jgi:hypothetical protein